MPCAISSIGSSADRAPRRIAAAALACAMAAIPCATASTRIAVFPPVDRTGRSAPMDLVQSALEGALSERGLEPVPRADLEAFLHSHRIRYAGGVSAETARATGVETMAAGILLTTVDDWETVEPPRFAMTCRLVEATPAAVISWMETSALHGHERPGAFGLGLVTDPAILIQRASGEISRALSEFTRTGAPEVRARVPRRFRPGSVAVDPAWAAAAASRRLRVLVLPFVVDAARRDIGELLASQFVRWLTATGAMEVLEPGLVREALLEARVIQEDGPSLPHVDALRALLDVDLIVSGRVTDFEALGSAPGSPFLGFSARAIDTRTRQAVWSSFSFGRGDDRVGPFGTSRIRSSITLTSELVRGAVEALDVELQRKETSHR